MDKISLVDITYDPDKNERNIAERGLDFEKVADFDFLSAKTVVDNRRDYSEVRYQALGFIGSRLHVLVYTETDTGIRVISLRKANSREQKRYESETRPRDDRR